MYGGTSKMGGAGRGGRGGGGGGRLSSYPPPPLPHRSSTPNKGSRLSLGGTSNPRNRSSGGPTNNATAAEETFSLIPGKNPLAFAMIIRLAPDLVDEIKKVEAQGSSARIKFDSMCSNNIGNVIDVGGKEFKFTWSKEFGDLCDIYEERESGEDGNGVLVESGSAWRKVNVQRILDESTKNHVKKLSEEAERKNKSRKAIVLDQGNPSMKSQIKQMALVESNPWRTQFNKRKDLPFKKQKVEPAPVPKTTFKTGVSSTASGKARHSSSPLLSTPQQSATPASPFGMGNSKNNLSTEELIPTHMKNKENASNLEKEIQSKAPTAAQETPRYKGNFGTKPTDLQSLLVDLLIRNPKGMSLKALEKAVGDEFPNSARKIDPIIRKIANYQAPGKYILKSGVDLESVKKASSESGSSPEDNHQQSLVPEDNRDGRTAPGSGFAGKSPAVGFDEHAQINSKYEEGTHALEKNDIQQDSVELFGEKKISDTSEGKAGSSSENGSDSDSESDSSDSGSESGSRSRSKSRSPVGSGSGSSSDSDSDASSNSKEGSDEDVDILSDDDKEPQLKLPASEPGFSTPPDLWRSVQNETYAKQDGDGSDAVDIDGPGSAGRDVESHDFDAVSIEKHLTDDQKEVKLPTNDSVVPNKESVRNVEGPQLMFSDHDAIQDRQNFIGTLFDDTENIVTDTYRHENSDSSERMPKCKSKRGYDMKHFDEKYDHVKRLKVDSVAQSLISDSGDAQFSESPLNRHMEENFKSPLIPVTNRADKDINADFVSQKAHNQAFKGKPSSDFQQPGRRSSDKNARSKGSDSTGKSKHSERSEHSRKFPEKGPHVQENFLVQKEKASRDLFEEDTGKEKKEPRNFKEGGAKGRHSASSDSQHTKQNEKFGKLKDTAQLTNLHTSPRDDDRVDLEKYPAVSGRTLQRELSELELGEFREPLVEEKPVKKQFDRKASFKLSDYRSSTSDQYNSDLSKAKPVGKAALDSGKSSPSNLGAGVKRTPDYHVDDATRSHYKNPQNLSRADNAEVGSHFTNGRLRQNDAGEKLGNSMEGYGENHRRGLGNAQLLHDSKRGTLSKSLKESKMQPSTTMPNLVDGQKDTTEINNNARKRRESSSEEDGSYMKYEKDAPEFKGPIKDFSQYKEYVQEYRDKYESYCSLNKILETYRNNFHKLGKDLEFTKGRDVDRYNKISMQLKESYRQCGERHKQYKKIFVVLHEELKNLKQMIKDYAVTFTKD